MGNIKLTGGSNKKPFDSAGINWVQRRLGYQHYTADITCGVYCPNSGLYVLISNHNVGPYVLTSTDGATWTDRSGGTMINRHWTDVCYSSDHGVLAVSKTVAGAKFMSSGDGKLWQSRTSPSDTSDWECCCYGANKFVALASAGTTRAMYGVIGSFNAATVPASVWSSVTFGKGLFVGVASSGTDRIITSPDGITWTVRTAPVTAAWSSITYGNGIFVAVARGQATNCTMWSTDGITWNAGTISANGQWVKVIYHNGLFIAAGTTGTSRYTYSTDGKNWIEGGQFPATNVILSTVALFGGYDKIIVAGFGESETCVFVSSPTIKATTGSDLERLPGEYWEYIKPIGSSTFYYIAACGDTYIIPGSNASQIFMPRIGDILEWDPVAKSTYLPSDKSFTFLNNMTGDPLKNSGFIGILLDSFDVMSVVVANSNAESWSEIATLTGNTWTFAGYLGSRYVIVGSGSPYVISSTNGSGFSAPGTSPVAGSWKGVFYGNGIYVLYGGTTTSNQIATSSNNMSSWTSRTTPKSGASYTCGEYGAGLYIAVSSDHVIYSSDLITWKITQIPLGTWNKIVYTGTNFVIMGKSMNGTESALISRDGITWYTTLNGHLPTGFNAGCMGTSYLIGVGASGKIAVSRKYNYLPENKIAVKYGAGAFWLNRSSSSSYWKAVTGGDVGGTYRYVAVSYGGSAYAATSDDGVIWTDRTLAAKLWYGVCYGNNKFVAVCDGITASVGYSSDGITWTTTPTTPSGYWMAVAYGYVNGTTHTYVIVGGGVIATSNDAITWTSRTCPSSDRFTAITFANGLFVAVGDNGTGSRIITSPDGITWTVRTNPHSGTAWNGVAYGNGKFVAVGSAPTAAGDIIITSTDGVTWSETMSLDKGMRRMYPSVTGFTSITFGNGMFVASEYNQLFTSEDGIIWYPKKKYPASTRSLFYGNGGFVGANENETNRFISSHACSVVYNRTM